MTFNLPGSVRLGTPLLRVIYRDSKQFTDTLSPEMHLTTASSRHHFLPCRIW